MDIVDFLLKTVFEFFGWLFNALLSLAIWLVGALFKGVAGLFKQQNIQKLP